MILLIDGYNLIKNVLGVSSITSKDKSDFIRKLHFYAKKKNHKVILVFDGGGYSYPFTETIGLVKVIYSGYKQSADDFIKNYIQENKNQNLLLITADRDIRNFASNFNIQSLTSYEFYDLFSNSQESIKPLTAEKTKDTLFKTTEQNIPDLDKLMEEASKIMVRKTEDRKSEPPKKQNSLSKKDKKIVQKIKKL